MNTRLKCAAQALIATTAVAAIGLVTLPFLPDSSKRMDILVISLALLLSGCSLGAVVLVVVCWVSLRLGLARYLCRRPLSDEEFRAMLGGSQAVDVQVVQDVRNMAARRFWTLGGGSFYPGDRLDEDLHLGDLAFFAAESFEYDLLGYLGLAEEDAPEEWSRVKTFGDVVLLVDRVRRRGAGESVAPPPVRPVS
jgi:hypothetical protein